MEFLLTKIKENLNEQMLLLTISNPRKAEEVKKYNIRPILVKDKLVFQSAAYTKTQVFHKNLSKRELLEEVQKILPLYKQVQLQTSGAELTALINKKGKAAIKVRSRIIRLWQSCHQIKVICFIIAQRNTFYQKELLSHF